VGIPDLPDGEVAALPTVLTMHPTMGYDDACAPSSRMEGAVLALLPATMGWIAVAPDGLGMCGVAGACPDTFHTYLLGEPTAIAAWDAVRAAHEKLIDVSDDTGVLPDGRVAPIGPSQGGHAALFVERYAAHYAPEYEVSCVVAAVPPGDLAGQATAALSRLSGATRMGLAFLAAAYLWYQPDVPASTLLNENGPRDYATYVMETYPDTCSEGALTSGASTLEDLFAPEFLAGFASGGWSAVEPWGCMAHENSLPWASVPYAGDAEILIVLGESDRIVSSVIEHETIETLCGMGYRIQHVECAGQSHEQAVLVSVTRQLGWVEECLAGARIPDDDVCVVHEPEACSL
jgi:hypothetical protein